MQKNCNGEMDVASDDQSSMSESAQRGLDILSITKDQLLGFVVEKECGRPCESCGHDHWTIAEDNDAPSLVSMDLVRKSGQAHWFFWMACNQCGNTRFVSSNSVMRYLQLKAEE